MAHIRVALNGKDMCLWIWQSFQIEIRSWRSVLVLTTPRNDNLSEVNPWITSHVETPAELSAAKPLAPRRQFPSLWHLSRLVLVDEFIWIVYPSVELAAFSFECKSGLCQLALDTPQSSPRREIQLPGWRSLFSQPISFTADNLHANNAHAYLYYSHSIIDMHCMTPCLRL